MKKVGDIMKEAGFNPNARDSVKEAFIKHLIKASTGVSVVTPSEKNEIEKNPDSVFPMKTQMKGQQMAFDFIEEISINPRSKTKKASTF